uniref:Uncharacterized protein n=1 Tax=Octopus bimaculoides TaxID=37653 RepID=A0A0L8HKL7_OCTBM
MDSSNSRRITNSIRIRITNSIRIRITNSIRIRISNGRDILCNINSSRSSFSSSAINVITTSVIFNSSIKRVSCRNRRGGSNVIFIDDNLTTVIRFKRRVRTTENHVDVVPCCVQTVWGNRFGVFIIIHHAGSLVLDA